MSINTMLFGKLCYRPQITKGSHITKVRHILIGSHIANSSVRTALDTRFHAASTRRAKSTRHAWI